eukprot:1957354-Ditylum_brightwellii.AAC.1
MEGEHNNEHEAMDQIKQTLYQVLPQRSIKTNKPAKEVQGSTKEATSAQSANKTTSNNQTGGYQDNKQVDLYTIPENTWRATKQTENTDNRTLSDYGGGRGHKQSRQPTNAKQINR